MQIRQGLPLLIMHVSQGVDSKNPKESLMTALELRQAKLRENLAIG